MTFKGNSSYATAAMLLLAAGLVLRVAWAMLVPVVPISDSVAYDTFATNLATHGVYGWTPGAPSSFWPVGTSAIYAALYWVFGHHFAPIVVLNLLLSTLIVLQTMWLARLFFDDQTAVVAGCILAMWPTQIAYVTILASELPFTLLTLLGMCVWYSPSLSKSARGCTSGLAFAAASYVRPIALLLPAVLWLTDLLDLRKFREQLLVFVLAVAVIAGCIAPWSIRNMKLYHHFMLISSDGGVALWIGNNPSSNGTHTPMPDSVDRLNEYERDKQLGEVALRYIINRPLDFVFRTIKKAILLHFNETIAVHWNAGGIKQRFGEGAILPLKVLMQTYWSLVLLLAAIGFTELVRNVGFMRALFHPILAPWIYFSAVYAVMLVQDRYHFPSDPYIAILAAIASVKIVNHLRHRAFEPQM